MDGGKGSDTTMNDGSGTEIYGGGGNDIISLNGGSATIFYNEGDGDGTYSTAANEDDDGIISTGDAKITLVGAVDDLIRLKYLSLNNVIIYNSGDALTLNISGGGSVIFEDFSAANWASN